MFKNMKISIKILLVIITMSLGSLIIVFAASYYFMNYMVNEFQTTNLTLGLNFTDLSKESLLEQTEYYLEMLVTKQADTANDELYLVNRNVTEAADYTHSLYMDSDNFVGKEMPRPDKTTDGVACQKYFLAKGVKETPAVKKEVSILSNCEYMFATILKNNPKMNNIYIGTKSGISYRYSKSNLYNPDYDPRERDWYKTAMSMPDHLIWLPTYLDSYGNTCITAAITYRDESGKVAGVVASDISLQDLVNEVTSLQLGETGTCFMLDENYNFVAHPDMGKENFDNNIRNYFPDNTFISALAKDPWGVMETTYNGKECYLAYSKLVETGWFFCASIEKDEITEPARLARDDGYRLTQNSQDNMQAILFNVFKLFMIYFAIVGILIVIISFTVSGTITRPIQRLTKSIQSIGEGNFDHKIMVESGDEVGQLARKFNNMQDDLKAYMENITQVTAEKEKIQTELSVAARIQEDMLPNIFPAFPDRTDIELFASMDPAKEVGGDFYDFFLVDKDHLALVIADVSDKGVPAALFMVIAKTLIKNHAQTSSTFSPAEVLTKANNQLCEGNEASLFVTTWFAIIDLKTGKGLAANAGHEHPALRRKDGKYELITYRHSPAVAVMEGMKFTEHAFQLYPGDSIFVYTDGVPEASNKEKELFGSDRMIEALNIEPDAPPEIVMRNVRKTIDEFVGDAPQFDDMTMLCFRYKCNE